MEQKIKLHFWGGLCWDIDYDDFSNREYVKSLCPVKNCHCELIKSKGEYSYGEYKYECIKCEFKITLNKEISEKAEHFIKILESHKYKDAEIINIDGELIKVQREQVTDNNYWADVKISKNTNGDVQLMILAGSKAEKDKTQLFLDIKNQKMVFDQNNDHPRKVFTIVTAVFKSSKSSIENQDNDSK